MKYTVWMLALSLVLVSCSRNKAAKDVSQEAPNIELSDADEFTENEAPVMATDEMAAVDEVPASGVEEVDSDVEAAPVVSNMDSGISLGERTYTVQANETLMMVAFKLYGDYDKWKELASYNQTALKGSTVVRSGMQLKYMAPSNEFIWNPEGNPYLIRTGDTLGLISGSVYGTPKHWRYIWDNNRPMIKNPNRIFAGFTLYWKELRGVAAGK